MYYSQNFTAKKSKTRTEPYLSLMTLYPRVDNKNNAKDPTRFHFSLRLSYNPPPKKKIKVKKIFFDTHQYFQQKSDRSKKFFNRIIN